MLLKNGELFKIPAEEQKKLFGKEGKYQKFPIKFEYTGSPKVDKKTGKKRYPAATGVDCVFTYYDGKENVELRWCNSYSPAKIGATAVTYNRYDPILIYFERGNPIFCSQQETEKAYFLLKQLEYSKTPLYAVEDKKAKSDERNKLKESKARAMTMIYSEIPPAELRDIARIWQYPNPVLIEEVDISEIKDFLSDIAERTPDKFIETTAGVESSMRILISKLKERGQIKYDSANKAWTYQNGELITKVLPNQDYFVTLVSFLINTPKMENTFREMVEAKVTV